MVLLHVLYRDEHSEFLRECKYREIYTEKITNARHILEECARLHREDEENENKTIEEYMKSREVDDALRKGDTEIFNANLIEKVN